MTIQQAYKNTISLLKKDGTDNAPLEARLLLCYFLNIDQKEFLLIKDAKKIARLKWLVFSGLIRRRISGESIASITKKKYFFDSEFYIDKRVFIPRPETETLIEVMIKTIDPKKELFILDVGTGSGILPIITAKHFPCSKIVAIDINKHSLKATAKNIKINNINENQIKLLNKNFFDFSPPKKYDIIISNPPYIQTDETKMLLKKKIVADPIISLDGGVDGLDFYHRIKTFMNDHLKKDGWIFIEHGIGQRDDILNIFKKDVKNISVYDDLAKIDRVISFQYKG